MTPGRIRVVVSDARGRGVAAAGLSRWLTRVAPSSARGLVNIALVSDARVRALNRRYRRRDSPTDVLSFPCTPELKLGPTARTLIPNPQSAPPNPQSAPPNPQSRPPNPQSPIPIPYLRPCLGDIVIARGLARRQARAAGHDEWTELRILALHGLLHLLGYDHHRDDGLMARMERRLRKKGGLREGLIERSRP